MSNFLSPLLNPARHAASTGSSSSSPANANGSDGASSPDFGSYLQAAYDDGGQGEPAAPRRRSRAGSRRPGGRECRRRQRGHLELDVDIGKRFG